MHVTVNGGSRIVDDDCTIRQLLSLIGCPERGVAVAIDRTVVPRARWAEVVPDEATVEILTAVQGG